MWNIKEAPGSIWSSSILASVRLFQLCWILLKHEPSVTHVVGEVTEGDGLVVPVIDPQVGGWWRERRPEAGDPVAGTRQVGARRPGPVPQAAHAELLHMDTSNLELTG